MLDKHHLKIIQEVNRLGSVTEAARSLNLTQSAVSHAIAKLERHFSINVWHRKSNKLAFTQAGEYLLSISKRLIEDFEHAEQVLHGFSLGQQGMLRIGMECHPCEKWLTEKISQFLIEWPRVDVELKNTFRYDGITALKANEIDLLVTPDPIENEHLHFTPVLDYTLCLVVSGEHPLARKQHIVPQDLAGEVLFTVPVSTNRLDLYTQFLSPAKVNPKRRISMDSVEMILRMVSANRGVSVLPDWLISPYQASLNIKPITIGHRGISKSINLGIRNEDTALAYMKWLISK